jgi:hypothetical protein
MPRSSWLLIFTLITIPTLFAQDVIPLTPEARDAAIARAYRYLDNNLWNLSEHGSPRKQYALAVAGWAYLIAADKPKGEKELPSRGKQLGRIREYLTQYVALVAHEYEQDDKNAAKARAPGKGETPAPPRIDRGPVQYNWPLSMAAHFFAESVARKRKFGSSRKTLRSIVKVLEAAQQPDGGWGHDDAARPGMGIPPIPIPKPGQNPGDPTETATYPHTLIAASNCVLSALGVAHTRLKSKNPKSLARGRKYFEGAQNKNGTFPYDPTQKQSAGSQGAKAESTEIARTGGAVFALLSAGANPQDAAILSALDAIDAHPEWLSEGHGSASMALQFGALLSRARGREAWTRFRGIFLPRILNSQAEDGSFSCVCKQVSPSVTCDTRPIPGADWPGYMEGNTAYTTALYVLILVLDRAELRAIPAMPRMRAPQTESPSQK